MDYFNFRDMYDDIIGDVVFYEDKNYWAVEDRKYGHKIVLPKFGRNSPFVDAMLQALYSRSKKSVVNRLEEIDEKRSHDFLKKYYIGYGHDSIADCGTLTLYIENVSFLGSKMIQDDPLYSGQESSSRYIDWSEQAAHLPVFDYASKEVTAAAFRVYEKCLETLRGPVFSYMEGKSPDVSEVTLRRAVDAYIFDIARGFLPVAARTNLSWHVSIRKLLDGIARLCSYEEIEGQRIGVMIYYLLEKIGVNDFISFDDIERRLKRFVHSMWFFDFDKIEKMLKEKRVVDFSLFDKDVFLDELKGIDRIVGYFEDEFDRRGALRIVDRIDFGSWRDLQRHRTGNVSFFSMYYRFSYPVWGDGWYFDMLERFGVSVEVKKVYEEYLKFSHDVIYERMLHCDVIYDAMFPIDKLSYMLKLRSHESVHPTVRKLVKKVLLEMCDEFGDGFEDYKRFLNESAVSLMTESIDGVGVQRGKDTITERR